MRTVGLHTLGCKLNQYETDALASAFRRRGYEVVDLDAPADAYVINTCTVTNKADRKSRNIINRAKRSRSPSNGQPLVVVTGCHAENHKDTLTSEEHVAVVGNDAKSAVDELVDAYLSGEISADLEPSGSAGGAHRTDRFAYATPERILHTRGMLKIQDGCDNFCTFCIIPHVRGRARSRRAEDVLEEARRCIDSDYRELVFTGVNMSRYDDSDTSFSGLVEQVLDLPGDFRVRISSLEPDRLDPRFYDLFAHEKMGSHLHLCVQSGSDRILLAMRRQYTVAEYRNAVETLRSRHPGINLTTDVIVGFPGETDGDFERTVDLVRWARFSHVHTFPYSVRTGTRAERMPGHLSSKVRSRRSEEIRRVAEENKRRYRMGLVGTTERLLTEQRTKEGAVTGYGEHYVPLKLIDGSVGTNEFHWVRVVDLEAGENPSLRAELVRDRKELASGGP